MDVLANIVMVHMAKNEFDAAVRRCDIQLQKVGDKAVPRAFILNMKGSILSTWNKGAEAEKAFKQAIQENPNFLPPYYSLARLYMREKRQDMAISQYNALLEKDPKQPFPHMLLGIIYDIQKEHNLAEEEYKKALELDPGFAPAANNLAFLLADQDKELDRALELAQKAKERLPDDPGVMDTLGWAYYKKGLYDSARSELLDSIEKMPDNAVIHYHLGLTYYKKGEKEKAREELEKALSLDNSFDGAKEAAEVLKKL